MTLTIKAGRLDLLNLNIVTFVDFYNEIKLTHL